MMRILFLLLCSVPFISMAARTAAQEKTVRLPERKIPVAYEVDVLVAGGTTGDVAAAVEAAKNGAKTMIMTDRPYFGSDMTATLRLWSEPDEKTDDPLAAALFNDPDRGKPQPVSAPLLLLQTENPVPFTYTLSEPLDPSHNDTPQKNMLTDRKASNAAKESIQVNGDATVMLDLKQPQEVAAAGVIAFYRDGDFAMEKVIVSAGNDTEHWTTLGEMSVKKHSDTANQPESVLVEWEKPVKTQYLKIEVKKTADAKRLLLGEIVLLPQLSVSVTKNQTEKADAAESQNIVTKYTRPAPRPMHVKMTLDKVLEHAGVKPLVCTYAAGTLTDKNGRCCGVLISSRAGTQAVLAKKVFHSHPIREMNRSKRQAPVWKAEYVVIGGSPQPIDSIDTAKYPLLKKAEAEIIGEPFYSEFPNRAKTTSGTHPVIRYVFELTVQKAALTLAERNAAENQIRLAAFDPDQQFTADEITFLQPDNVRLTTTEFIAEGRKYGKQLAEEAKNITIPPPEQLTARYDLPERKAGKNLSGTVRETEGNIKAFKKPSGWVTQQTEEIPVIGEYDVVVVGGGTSGAPAGIASARQGAKTLVLEYLHDLGGTGTAGAISNYWYGNQVGFCKEVENGKAKWNIEQRIQWWRSKLAEAGADVWYGVLGSGAVLETKSGSGSADTVKGVLITTINGPRVVLAKTVIDATGNGSIAAAAGAEIKYVDGQEIASQGHGLPPRNLGAAYVNTDYMYVDETDIEDVTQLFIYGKEKFPKAFDFGKLPGTRERPRIDGDFTLSVLDIVNKRTYPDTICRSRSNFDTHGYTVVPYMDIEHLHHAAHFCDIPYRCSLPKGIERLLAGGLATSCHRDALPIIRMQPDLQNQGYALGCIAAKAAKENVPLRELDIRPVQEHLVQIGNLPARVLTDSDNYEAGKAALPDAVKTLPDEFKGAALLLWHPDEAKPLLQDAYQKAPPENKLAYAMVLAGMNDPTGADVLLEKVQSYSQWDKGWNFRGMGQFGWASSELDRYVMMLGRTGDKRAAAVIGKLLEKLKAADDFSHHRACALALERLGDPSAVPVIAAHLRKPDVAGHHQHDLEAARRQDKADPKGATAEKSRRDSLLEIGFARALYRLGDSDNLGKTILENYSADLRGYFSRHACEVLGKK
ncbi:MAG: FAD-dependent oxidoreductase [Planctomycetaceae bacterium]|jgi:hypothetical protein|nr:FAD-dependent oxidoreductase [Planctomycetaceae bacterium]